MDYSVTGGSFGRVSGRPLPASSQVRFAESEPSLLDCQIQQRYEKMKKSSLFVFLIGLFLFLVSCVLTRYHNPDPFYSSYEDWDLIRFPLIKPYEAGKLQNNDWWGVSIPWTPNSPSLLYSSGVPYVQKIAVENDVIMVYTPYEPVVSENLRDDVFHWFVFVPGKDIRTGFYNESDFLVYVRIYNISEVEWEDPDNIFQRFRNTGCLEWIPGCQ
jgi:hypothetical protein